MIPTILAIWNVYFKKDAEFVSSQNISVSFREASSDKVLAEDTVGEENISDSAIVSLFFKLKSQRSISEPPTNAPKAPNFKLLISHGDSSVQYECYFSQNAAQSYILGEGNEIYSVNHDKYALFLASDYSDSIYSNATPPVLSTENGATVMPYSVSWNFKKSDGVFKKSTGQSTVSSEETYQMSGTLALNFDIIPDACDISIREIASDGSTDNEIYRGDLQMLQYVTVQSGQRLLFSVEALWERSDKKDAYGNINYKFIIDCKDYATFEVSTQSVLPGQFLSIILHDVNNPESVVYEIDTESDKENSIFYKSPKIGSDLLSSEDAITFLKKFKPSFVSRQNLLIALLPIPYGTPSGSFNFTVASGVTQKSFSITVGEAIERSEVVLDKPDSQLTKLLSSSSLDEVTLLLESISKESRTGILFAEAFAPPPAKYTLKYSFADNLIISGNNKSIAPALGNMYSYSSTVSECVYSANSGIVTYTGHSSLLGNTVVIDHGMGLLTWYCNLGDTDVTVGTAVAKGELIGKTGESTLTSGNGVLILCSIDRTFIDPSFILGNKTLP